MGYANTPTAIGKGTGVPNKSKSKAMNLVMPKILSMVNEPKKIPLSIINTHSLRLFFISVSNIIIG